MDLLAHEQLAELEQDHWWLRGRRDVCVGLLDAALDGRRVRRALDVGAGAGGFLAPLCRMADHVVYVDVEERAVSRCGARGFSSGVVAAGSTLPFADASFNLVTLFDVLEHLDDDVGALTEVARVLRPGGLAFVHVPAYPLLYAENDRVCGHRRRYTRSALATCVEGAGLELTRNTHTNALLLPLIAPLVLAKKLGERLGHGRGRTNLSWDPPRWVHAACHRAFRSELVLSRRVDLGVGHSIAAVGRKRGLADAA